MQIDNSKLDMNDMDAVTIAFLAFAKTKPADEEFYYASNADCAFAQFLRETGITPRPSVGSNDWDEENAYGPGFTDKGGRIPAMVANELIRRHNGLRTFGALVHYIEAHPAYQALTQIA